MSVINVTVTNAGAANVSVSNGSTVNATVGNGGAVNVTTGTISPGNATVVSGTLTINSTTTLAPGSNATVTNKGTAYAAVLDLGIPTGAAGPQGAQGPAGINGINGINGVTPSFAIGNVVTGAAGSSASVTATPSNGGANVTLDLTIPRGDPGASGSNGTNGTSLTLSDATPSALGTASAGTSSTVSRADHVHALPVIAYANLSGVPSNFPTNTTLVSGLQAALDAKQAAGNYVTGLNNLTGSLTLAPGANVTITPSGSTLTIDATAGGGGIGANDAIDGGSYVGEILYGITFSSQPQSQTLNSSTTVNLATLNVSISNTVSPLLGGLASYGNALYSASPDTNEEWQLLRSTDNGSSWGVAYSLYQAGANVGVQPAVGPLSSIASNGTRSVFASGNGLFRSDASDLSALTYVTGLPYANSVAWNGVRFVASFYLKQQTSAQGVQPVTYAFARYLYSSSDGVSWTERLNTGGGDDGGLPVLSVNGVFVLVRTLSSPSVLTSSDGVNWSQSFRDSGFLAWASSGTKIVAVNGTTASYTTNGTAWSTATLPVSCNAVSHAAGLFWAFRSGQSTTDVCYSGDGVTWTLGTMPASTGWTQAAASSNTVFLQGISTNFVRSYARAAISTTPASANLTVSATAASGNPVAYQWQSSLDAGTSWGNVANATNSAINLTGLTGADNGTRYRVIASATGATPATSQSATLTVTG